ncbi:MAG: RluA family pseudouridine synthase [Opitutaceae bacterium]|nr:RluA family pseudouridine synthase [Opitutaceae bacterium]
MPETEKGYLITPEELASWILLETEDLLVLNKPGLVVCHPSKFGPWSSLVGACREFCGLDPMHLVFRLDRETSGVVVLAKNKAAAGRFQGAVERRNVHKSYIAILEGELSEIVEVDKPLGRDVESVVFSKDTVTDAEGSKGAQTRFEPVVCTHGYTIVKVYPKTGRKHQIRAHAQWLGTSVVGDKIYGPDARLFLQFIETGWTPELAKKLGLKRQALHAMRIAFDFPGAPEAFNAPVPQDMELFCQERMNLSLAEILQLETGEV